MFVTMSVEDLDKPSLPDRMFCWWNNSCEEGKKVIPDADQDRHIPRRGSAHRDEAHPQHQRGRFPFHGCVSCLTIGTGDAPVGD